MQTISNAMDVGNPSNFIRIQELYKNNFETLKENLSSFSFSNEETKVAMLEIYSRYGYVADPHGAVGYLGCKAYLEKNPTAYCVFFETAHPTKFLDIVEAVIKKQQALPPQIKSLIGKVKEATKIDSYEDLKHFLITV